MTTTQLPENVLEKLRTDGATAGWVGDRLGIGHRQAGKLMKQLSLHYCNGKWHLRPAYAKPKTYGNARACVSSPFTSSDFKDGGRE